MKKTRTISIKIQTEYPLVANMEYFIQTNNIFLHMAAQCTPDQLRQWFAENPLASEVIGKIGSFKEGAQ